MMRVPASFGLQDARHDLGLVDGVRPVGVLLDALDQLAVVLIGVDGPDVRRLVHVPTGQRDHVARHRRREEHGLPVGGRQRNDALDVGQEPHVEHLVGLVQHESLDGAKVQVTLLDEVEQAPWRADHDVDAGLERLDLWFVRATAVDGQHPGAARLARVPDLAGDLHGELARGDDDERLGVADGSWSGCTGSLGATNRSEQWEREAERLSGAGLGLADDVVAVERHREGEFLDGKCLGDAQVSQVGHRFGTDAEVSKCSQGVRLAGR